MGQIPPAYSAKKVDGQKAYAVARKGGELNLRPTYITVSRFAVLNATHHIVEDQATEHAVCDVEVEIDCTKGTYIRALARDLGKTLAVGGYLTALRRTSSGPFSEDSLLSVEEIVRRVKET
jgi:tRNA pseudouridine55 synthase